MIVAWRSWAVRRVETGRVLARPKPVSMPIARYFTDLTEPAWPPLDFGWEAPAARVGAPRPLPLGRRRPGTATRRVGATATGGLTAQRDLRVTSPR